jgi:hypothetical protein
MGPVLFIHRKAQSSGESATANHDRSTRFRFGEKCRASGSKLRASPMAVRRRALAFDAMSGKSRGILGQADFGILRAAQNEK